MIRGFSTSVTALSANIAREAVTADNIANVNTPGFKESRTGQSAFELELASSAGGLLGPLGTATAATGPVLDRTDGALEPTGNPTDLAIQGDGLFVVQTATGIAYTRAGDFVIDVNGRLTTQAGEPVLGVDGQPIIAPAGATSLIVGPDGSVAQTGQRLAIAAWPAGGLIRLGGTLLGNPDGRLLAPSTGTVVIQGMVERSNVDLARAMTELIGLQRGLGLNARALSIQDETLGEAVQLGRPR
jgi:flagellar basal body rod protein FlgG